MGNGTKIQFWEDKWFGSSPLAVQFWEIYVICNEKLVCLSDVWDGYTVKLSFRRNFLPRLIEQWYELEQFVMSTALSEEQDTLVWQYNSSGVYSTKSLYSIINFRGIMPLYIPALWSLVVPPRIHIFIWLLSHNRIMTRDNLKKKDIEKPEDCVFCTEKESVNHLFFDCVVARALWCEVSMFFNKDLGSSYESIARYWVANSRLAAMNTICIAIMWCLWTFRNDMITLSGST